MTKQECEKKLLDMMEDAFKLFREYDSRCTRLTMYGTNEGCAVFGDIKVNDNMIVFNIHGYKKPNGSYELVSP